MESCCDIVDQLPSEMYNYIFGDKMKDFVQLRSLRSRIKAKILKFDKLLQNATPAYKNVTRPAPVPSIQHTPTSSTMDSVCDIIDNEEMCPDLADFLRLNEEERDTWGLPNDLVVDSKQFLLFVPKIIFVAL